MAKRLFYILIFWIPLNCLAQIREGLAIYGLKFEPRILSTNTLKSKKFDAFNQKLKDLANTCEFELVFNDSISIFKFKDALISDSNQISPGIFNTGPFFINSLNNKVFNKKELKGQIYILEMQALCWIIKNETKIVNGRTLIKAVSEKEFYSVRQGKNLYFPVEAWFDPSIPLNTGPLDFFGLPGLIVEVSSRDVTYYLKSLKIENVDLKGQIEEFKNGEHLSQKEFQISRSELALKFKDFFSID